jgi:hypothetical protein
MNPQIQPFSFATLSSTFRPHPSNIMAAPAAATPAFPATLPCMMMASPAGFVPPPPKPVPALDHELKWSDLDEHDIRRFQLEEQGRCYASNYPYDRILDVYRNVYFSYPDDVRNGSNPVPEDHHSGIFYRDVKNAENE